jgi:tRNA(Ile)-lysidine synthetase-like protein
VEPTYYKPQNVKFPTTSGLLDPNCNFDINTDIGINKETGKNEEIPKEWNEYFSSTILSDKKNIIISISGGGDSMACCYLLKKMGYNVTGVMIDYNNRTTCVDEVQMVHWWCSKLHIECIHRNQKACLREIYEPITRQIRFNGYKKVAILINADEPRVVLGHNKDDTFENIIANLSKHRSMHNLRAIKPSHLENDVWIYRPIRDIQKKDITQFLQNINAPYLYDSTPSWSFRGRVRDTLVPQLNTFDHSLIGGIEKMADIMYNMSKQYFKMLEEKTEFTKVTMSVSQSKHSVEAIRIVFNTDSFDNENYWSYIFTHLREKYNYPGVGNKKITNIIDKLKKSKWPDKLVKHTLQGNVQLIFDKDIIHVYQF